MNYLPQQATEAAVSKAASAATFGGGGTAVYFGLTSNEWAAWAGVAIALVGLLVNFYFKQAHLSLAKQARQRAMASELGEED